MPAKDILQLINQDEHFRAWQQIRAASQAAEVQASAANIAVTAERRGFALAEFYLFSDVVRLFFKEANPNFPLFFKFLGLLKPAEVGRYLPTMLGLLKNLEQENAGLLRSFNSQMTAVSGMPFLEALKKAPEEVKVDALLGCFNHPDMLVADKLAKVFQVFGMLGEPATEVIAGSSVAKLYQFLKVYLQQKQVDYGLLVCLFCDVPVSFVSSFINQFPAFFPQGLPKFTEVLSVYFEFRKDFNTSNNLLHFLILLNCFCAESYQDALCAVFYKFQRFYTEQDVMLFASSISNECLGLVDHLGGLELLYPTLVALYRANVDLTATSDAATALIVSQLIQAGWECHLPGLINQVSLKQLPFIFSQILNQSKPELARQALTLILAREGLTPECQLEMLEIVRTSGRCPKELEAGNPVVLFIQRFLHEHAALLASYKQQVLLPMLRILQCIFPRLLVEACTGDKLFISRFRQELVAFLNTTQRLLPDKLKVLQPASALTEVLWAFFHNVLHEHLAGVESWSKPNLALLFSDQRLQAIRKQCGENYPGVLGVVDLGEAEAQIAPDESLVLMAVQRNALCQLGLSLSIDHLRNFPALLEFSEQEFFAVRTSEDLPELLCLVKTYQIIKAVNVESTGAQSENFVAMFQAVEKACQRHLTLNAARDALVAFLQETQSALESREQKQVTQIAKALCVMDALNANALMRIAAQAQTFFAGLPEVASVFQTFMQAFDLAGSLAQASAAAEQADFDPPTDPFEEVVYDDDDGLAALRQLPQQRRAAVRHSRYGDGPPSVGRASLASVDEEDEDEEQAQAAAEPAVETPVALGRTTVSAMAMFPPIHEAPSELPARPASCPPGLPHYRN